MPTPRITGPRRSPPTAVKVLFGLHAERSGPHGCADPHWTLEAGAFLRSALPGYRDSLSRRVQAHYLNNVFLYFRDFAFSARRSRFCRRCKRMMTVVVANAVVQAGIHYYI